MSRKQKFGIKEKARISDLYSTELECVGNEDVMGGIGRRRVNKMASVLWV